MTSSHQVVVLAGRLHLANGQIGKSHASISCALSQDWMLVSLIYTLMKDGKFPKAMRLGVRAVGWDSSEIDQWISDRLKERI